MYLVVKKKQRLMSLTDIEVKLYFEFHKDPY